MNRLRWLLAGLLGVLVWSPAEAQSLWARRDPRMASLFQDYRARHVGDLLTIVVNESTEFEGMEKRELNKETKNGATYGFKASAGSDVGSKSVNADLDTQLGTVRKFDGKNNSTIDRKFLDRMTVTVVGVMPNGNLLVQGHRKRVLTREIRTLLVSGVVRPADIGPFNTVQSQYIADFDVVYAGKGPESSYTNQGWGGRILNKILP